MRYALISDIHANLPALRAVLADIQGLGPVTIFHLGDLVGYGASPNEVVSLIRESGIAGLAGNYDSTVAAGYKHCGCRYEDPVQSELSHKSFEWTRANVSADTGRWLASLPFRLDVRPFGGHVTGPTLMLIHGNQTLNTVYVTEDRSDDFLKSMGAALGAAAGDLVAFGHTHLPWRRPVGGVHFVNTGSVGRPKDGDPRAGYVVLDIEAGSIHVDFRRVEYDVEAAVASIRASGLPVELAEVLRTGGKSQSKGT